MNCKCLKCKLSCGCLAIWRNGRNKESEATSPHSPLPTDPTQISLLPKDMGLEVLNVNEDEDNSLTMATKMTSPDSTDGRNEESEASSPHPQPEDPMQRSPLPKDMGLEVLNVIEDEDNSLTMATKMTSPDSKDGRNEESEASSPHPQPEDPMQISLQPKDMKEEHRWETAEDPSKNKEEPRRRNNQQEVKELFTRLNLRDNDKLSTSDVLKIDVRSCQPQGPNVEGELAHTFLNLLFTMDYKARYISIKEENNELSLENVQHRQNEDVYVFATLFDKKGMVNEGMVNEKQSQIHPMDVQMAVFHSADPFLRQSLLTKLSMCQYALPLLVPNPFTSEIEFPLWAFRQVWKSWKSTDASGTVTTHNKPMYGVETPMVSVFRLGPVSTSKSQLINALINERHSTFFHRHCPGSSRTRLLMDGVVEIAWYCPSGKDTDLFPECIAICNLRGDGEAFKTQQTILSEMASVNVAFLPSLSETSTSMAIEKELFGSPTPLIYLLTEDDSPLEEVCKGKFKMGLRDRNQSDIVGELKKAINYGLSQRNYSLEKLTQQSGIKMDEDDGDCRKGKEVALKIGDLLKGKKMSKVKELKRKETFLPCQGKLWHEWCQKNKDLFRLHGNLEKQKSQIKQDMGVIRSEQQKAGCSDLMKLFLDAVHSLPSLSRRYFLKWTSILIDSCTSDELVALHHEYDEKWSKVLVLKKKHDKSDQLEKEQTELENISHQLNAATFGLEHILREMGQIYEADISVKSGGGVQSKLPAMAAELMISGHPLELMDGDAGHVPLNWISAVFDEVIKKIGDKRIFVLSILGIQSSGKSTMLNAMFGLQFAVSAGRCTRGAFMQLISVSEDMKAQFDYILVVDTEGLRALQLAGKATIHHDNELATFVMGIGHMTLINIFGENPAEMQDILQIAVQAFLRMKKVNLAPSCVFVHQNVGDITAGEKNMEGKRRLQDKLDEMTQLAAKEEDCDAKCFSDVIAFDIQKDVKYFAQLWEGSPPMAPPNPCYSESVRDLKKTILSKASESKGMKLSEFKTSISDLWNALLNENFVFSFKNILEIAMYRKLETEYGNWIWSLRKAMLLIENKLHNRIENDLNTIEETFLLAEIRPTYEEVKKTMAQYFDEHTDKEMLVQWRGRFESKISDVHSDFVKETPKKLNYLIEQKKARQKVDEMKAQYENILFKKSKDLALSLKQLHKSEEALKKEFNKMWEGWLQDLTKDVPHVKDCNIREDNDLEKQRDNYYKVFNGFCQKANSDEVLGNFIWRKVELSIKQAMYDQTAIDLAADMRFNFPAFNGNRLNLERHILLSLADEENFDKFINYIHNPKEHFESFITEQVMKYMEMEKSPNLLSEIKRNLNHKIKCARLAAQTATERVKTNKGDANMWLRHFSDELKDELKFAEKSCVDASEITDFEFLEDLVCNRLDKIVHQLGESFNQLSLLKTEQFRRRPDEILIEHFSKCCWVQCPFCKAICTNTLEDHPNDHSVPFHRPDGLNGWHYKNTTNLSVDFCTTAVASNGSFRPSHDTEESIPYKEYKSAGPDYANWSITPDSSELPYWKWFMCRFKDDLEKYYNKQFEGKGKIPEEWIDYTKEQAKDSLDVYMLR